MPQLAPKTTPGALLGTGLGARLGAQGKTPHLVYAPLQPILLQASATLLGNGTEVLAENWQYRLANELDGWSDVADASGSAVDELDGLEVMRAYISLEGS